MCSVKIKMNKKLIVFKEFIDWQRKQEKKDGYVNNDDLTVLYRFINDIGGWEKIYEGKNGNSKN